MAEGFEKTTDFDSIPLNLNEPKKDGSAVKSTVEVKEVSADSLGLDDVFRKEDKDEKKLSLKRFFSLKKAGEELKTDSTPAESLLDTEHKRGSLARRLRLKSGLPENQNGTKKEEAENKSKGQPKISKTKSLQNTISVYWNNVFHSKSKPNQSSTINTETQTQTDYKEPSSI